MDNVKVVVDFIRKNNFWIICGLLVILVLTFALRTAGQMRTAREKNESTIKSAISTVKNVLSTKADVGEASVVVHPNSSTLDGMTTEIKKASTVAIEAWKKRREAQAPWFKWPEVLGEHAKTFEALPVPEKIPLPAFVANAKGNSGKKSDESEVPGVSSQILTIYGNEIHKVIPKIAQIIQADWRFDSDGKKEDAAAANPTEGFGALGNRGAIAQNVGPQSVEVKKNVVVWDPNDQQRWHTLVTEFDPINIQNRPNMVQAVYIQENLWLLEAIFRVIKEVNGDADSNDNAAIKRIDHLFFGRDAQGLSGVLSPVDPRLAVQARGKRRKDLKAPSKSGAAQTVKPPANPNDMRTRFDPADGRFVDANFRPLSADTVREAVATNKLSDRAELNVAKRIPFRMAFVMDERKIPDFLAACANSPFRFEIRQVRVNRHVPGQTGDLSEDTAGANQPQNEEETGGFASSGGGKLRGSNSTESESPIATRTNYFVKVEFFGFVKIYNPVNYRLFEMSPEGETQKQTASN